MLLELKRKDELPERLYQRIYSTAGKIPLINGLPKVHKPGIPLSPIVSFTSSPTYKLSKHMSDLLSLLVGRSFSAVRNSKGFVEFISAQSLEEEEVLVSFDVTSLFTNIPINKAIDVAVQRLNADETLDTTNLAVQSIINLLRLYLEETLFQFRGQYYQQTFGTALGSSVSMIVVNLVMEEVEERALATFDPPPQF